MNLFLLAQKALQKRRRFLIYYLFGMLFLALGISLAFVFVGRANRVGMELLASVLAFLLVSLSFGFFVGYFVPLGKELRLAFSYQGKTLLEEKVTSFCLTDERTVRQGVSFFVGAALVEGTKKTYFIAPLLAPSLKGKDPISLKSVDGVVVEAATL
jgi:hypothetical protein